MADIDETLEERGKRYGNYLEQTKISASLQDVMHKARDFSEMDEDQQDALEMIAVKISRILNGDPWYADNWHDIAGYATLVGNRMENL